MAHTFGSSPACNAPSKQLEGLTSPALGKESKLVDIYLTSHLHVVANLE